MKRTYWHLDDLQHKPNDYDIATTKLLYHPERGFSVKTPTAAFDERYGRASRVVLESWEAFTDPQQFTYTSYVASRSRRETFIDGLLEAMERPAYRRGWRGGWVEAAAGIIPVLRFPFHGLQMAACHVGHLARSGRITVVCALQAADEMRRIQRLAYTMAQLRQVRANLGDDSRLRWQDLAPWQPLRRLIEQLLVTYDWVEAFVALNLALKPVLDGFFVSHLGALARAHGDFLWAEILTCLNEDSAWHREWAIALCRFITSKNQAHSVTLGRWLAPWRQQAIEAVLALRPVLEAGESLVDFDALFEQLITQSRDLASTLQLGDVAALVENASNDATPNA